MPKFIIERDITGVGGLDAERLAAFARRSCHAVAELGPHIQWVQSHVTDDRMYCTYVAPNEEILREHARRTGFKADRIAPVRCIIDPTTAEGDAAWSAQT